MAFTLDTGAQAPNFNLPGSDGRSHTFTDVKGERGTLIFFTCNHCPYVVGSEDRMVDLFNRVTPQGIAMVAIHSNETADHPSDSFEEVLRRAREMGLPWLSLHDASQLTARAFGAERTPHSHRHRYEHEELRR